MKWLVGIFFVSSVALGFDSAEEAYALLEKPGLSYLEAARASDYLKSLPQEPDAERLIGVFQRVEYARQLDILQAFKGREKLSDKAVRFLGRLLLVSDAQAVNRAMEALATLTEIHDPDTARAVLDLASKDRFALPKNGTVNLTELSSEEITDQVNRTNGFSSRAMAVHALPRLRIDSEVIHDSLMKIAVDDSNPWMSLYALRAAGKANLVSPAEFLSALQKARAETSPELIPPRLNTLMELAESRQVPESEHFVVDLLEHSHPGVRSNAIDLLRKWGTLSDPKAISKLQALAPRLKGYALNVVTELLLNGGHWARDERAPEAFRQGEQKKVPNPTGSAHDHPTFLRLYQDAFDEAREFSLDPGARERFLQFEDNLWKVGDATRFEASGKGSGSEEWTRTTVDPKELTPLEGASHTRTVLPRASAHPAHVHSMPDLTDYLTARLGKQVVSSANESQIQVEIFGGYLGTLVQHYQMKPESLVRIPSPYSDWGIEKYLDTAVSPPRFFFVMPPNQELVQHYASMFANLKIPDVKATLSERDREHYRAQVQGASSSLAKSFKHTPDMVILGYDYAWKEAIASDPKWNIVDSETKSIDCGKACAVHGTVIVIERGGDPSTRRNVLLLGSGKTIWGEASVFLMEGVKQAVPNLRDAIFLGSAGSPGTRVNYGISLPARFLNAQGEEIDVDNFASLNRFGPPTLGTVEKRDGRWETKIDLAVDLEGDLLNYRISPTTGQIPIVIRGTHGWSVSPAEQSRDFVSQQYLDKGVHTVDVETSLLAEYFAKHPETRFSALHLITDNPASGHHTEDSGRSLTDVKAAEKALARSGILGLTLSHFDQRVSMQKVQERFGKNCHSSLPMLRGKPDVPIW